jgi:hypothetical protein
MIGKIALTAAFLAFALPAAAAERSLDTLFEGLDNACEYTEPFGNMFQSIYAFARKEGQLTRPKGYEEVFGELNIKPVDEYLHITMPVIGGTWRGVPIKEIEIEITPLESGLSAHAIVFETKALKEAETAFKTRGEAAQKKLTKLDDGGYGWQTGFFVRDGVPRFECNLST